jgi:RNA-directed DNA polymerase
MAARATGTLATVARWENLWLAYGAAARFAYRVEDELLTLTLACELRDRPGPCARFSIREPKRRVISAAPLRDRVVHHAVCQVIEPAFGRSFTDAPCASRRGRGTHRYVLPCDLRAFFPSIDHAVLRTTLWQRIADPGLRGWSTPSWRAVLPSCAMGTPWRGLPATTCSRSTGRAACRSAT